MGKSTPGARKIIATNRKARFRFHLLDRFEAGIVLTGSEVKSLRQGNVQINEAYVRIRNDEAFLLGANIGRYEQAGYAGHDPVRMRKLLLHKREIRRLRAAVEEKGCTIVPLSVFFTHGIAKVEIAIARGKRVYDKRDSIRKRDAEREIRRAEKRRQR